MLFISGFLPSVRVPSGGQNLAARALAEFRRNEEVDLIAFCNARERSFFEIDEFKECRSVTIFQLGLPGRVIAGLRHPSLPAISACRFFHAARVVRNLCIRNSEMPVWIEFTQAAALLGVVPASTPTTLVVHDLFYQALERRSRHVTPFLGCMLRVEAARTRRWEARVLRQPNRLICINEKDREGIRQLCGRVDVEVRYPSVDERFLKVRRSPLSVQPGAILFWGLMSRSENEDAAQWFVADVLPRVRSQLPHAEFWIAGAMPSDRVKALANEHVKVLGFVDDPVPLFERAAIAVAPLRLGSGIKIKVLEFLAARLPTIATPVGAEGVCPSEDLTIAEGAEEFSACCVERLKIADSGRFGHT